MHRNNIQDSRRFKDLCSESSYFSYTLHYMNIIYNKATSLRFAILLLFIFNSIYTTSASEVKAVDSTFIADEKYISELVSELINIRFDDTRLDELSQKITNEFGVILNKKGSLLISDEIIKHLTILK